jgi:hypothetical protein
MSGNIGLAISVPAVVGPVAGSTAALVALLCVVSLSPSNFIVRVKTRFLTRRGRCGGGSGSSVCDTFVRCG